MSSESTSDIRRSVSAAVRFLKRKDKKLGREAVHKIEFRLISR